MRRLLTAGHRGTVTGAAVASPASWPAPLIDVRIGSNKSGQGEKAAAYCAGADSDFDPQTMACAGLRQGGVDTCQGPLYRRTTGGELKVVGATSFGEGCACAGNLGLYARVADTTLREWIRSQVPHGVD